MPISDKDLRKRHKETQSINEALGAFTKAFRLEKGLSEAAIVNHWRTLMGDTVADKTKSLQIFNKVLTVKVSSAPLKAQLMMMKTDIIKKINEQFGSGSLTDINFK